MKDETKSLVSIESDVFELRMIFLLETNCQSNKYHQLVLTREQYIKINKAIQDAHPLCEHPEHQQAGQLRCGVLNIEDKVQYPLDSEIRPYV